MLVRLLLVASLLAAASLAPPARAQEGCPGGSCVLSTFPAVGPIVLEGGEQGGFLFSALSGLPAARFGPVPLAAPLDAEQQALLGCGPYWGTACERSGIDLRNVDACVLTQRWPAAGSARFAGDPFVVPGSRGLSLPRDVTPDPYYDIDRDGSNTGLVIPPQFGASAGQQFASELVAVSYNLQLLLVAFSSGNSGPPGSDPSAFDPNDPNALYDPNDPSTWSSAGQCSFLQPQYCSGVQALFEVQPPPPGQCSFAQPQYCSSVSTCFEAGPSRSRLGRRAFSSNAFGRHAFGRYTSGRRVVVPIGKGCLPARRATPSRSFEPVRYRGRCPSR